MTASDDVAVAKQCGLNQVLVFVGALIAGTLCSLTSKILLSMKGPGLTGEEEVFSSPLFQTFSMFFVLNMALVFHWLAIKFKLPFPGYDFSENLDNDEKKARNPRKVRWTTYLLLIFPSIFDIAATCLAMFGLMHVNVSIYQILRGKYSVPCCLYRKDY